MYYLLYTVLPKKPTNLQCSEIKSRSAKLTWLQLYDTEEEKPTRYRINVKPPQLDPITIDGTSLEHTLTGLQPGETYRVSIAAENSSGLGVDSDEVPLQTTGK